MRKTFLAAVALSILTICGFAVTRLVPSQYPNIQAGINAAVDGDIVLVADGTYSGTGNYNIDFIGKAIVVMSENGAESCVINCQGMGRGFYFHTNEDSTSALTGFTIRNGEGEGGGIFCISSAPTIVNCIFRENNSAFDGGALACFFGADSKIDNCIFDSNEGGGWGGGIYIDASLPVISNCDFINNGVSGQGGGIYICGASPVMTNCYFYGNSAQFGGAIAYDIGGATIINCIFEGNAADLWGGALYIKYGEAIIDNCLFFRNNSGEKGGAIAVNMAEAGINNCTISENYAIGDGGGLFVHWSSGISVVNCIVERNIGNGGFYCDGDLSFSEISYSDFYNNQNLNFAGGEYPAGLGEIITINANGDSCDIYNNIFLDPQFVNPSRGDFHLTSNSPCIDAGDPTSPLDPDSTIADIGAFYFDQTPGAITDLRITIQGNDVVLEWSPAAGAVSYNVYRSTEAYFTISPENLLITTTDIIFTDVNAIFSGDFFYEITFNTR